MPPGRARGDTMVKCRPVLMLCCAAVLFANGCGRKDDPFLSAAVAPRSVRDFVCQVRGDTAVLSWQAPRRNSDDSPLRDLAGFRVMREKLPVAQRCATCPPLFDVFDERVYAGPRGQVPADTRIEIHDAGLQPEYSYRYRVLAVNEGGHYSRPSADQAFVYRHAPAAPMDLVLSRQADSVHLAWQPVTDLAAGQPLPEPVGYRVYRRTADEPHWIALQTGPQRGTTLIDTPPVVDREYRYRVCAVRQSGSAAIESQPSAISTLAFADLTPPPVPDALTVVPQTDGVLLRWLIVDDHDVRGVYVYRRTGARGTFVRLNESPLTGRLWYDHTVERNVTYEYAVTAVDTSPRANESALSPTVTVTYIVD